MKANKLVNFHSWLILQQFDLIIINSKCNFFFYQLLWAGHCFNALHILVYLIISTSL